MNTTECATCEAEYPDAHPWQDGQCALCQIDHLRAQLYTVITERDRLAVDVSEWKRRARIARNALADTTE